MPVVIYVVGGKKSGKTTTIEQAVKHLVRRGRRVAVAKHIPEPDFTIDTEGKDTWRFSHAGAKVVVGLSANEIATIEKAHTAEFSLSDILQRCGDTDIVFLEGFTKLAWRDKQFPKIIVAKSADDVAEAVGGFEPILAFSGAYCTEKDHPEVPYVNVRLDPEKLADVIDKLVEK